VDEAAWDACRDPGVMLLFLRAAPLPSGGRRLRLFAVACARRAAPGSPQLLVGLDPVAAPPRSYGATH
jgi:hypothetical protein